MDKNLENDMQSIMDEANKNVNNEINDSIDSMAAITATFYKSLVSNGVPRVVAVLLTREFISSTISR